MVKKIFFLVLLITFITSCTRDDICAEETPKTPFLIINFKSKINPLLSKEVPNLTVTTIVNNETIDLYKSETIDSIAIPLNVLANTTEYLLIKGNTITNDGKTDTATFNYERDNIYINKACAFKTIYRDLTTQLEVEEDNWINEIEINKLIIENEDEAHVTIFH
jgi:hypothetical protein